MSVEPTNPAFVSYSGITAYGSARLTPSQIAGLRKTLPRWAPADTQIHFFKYSDEQVIAAVQAIDNAIQQFALSIQEQTDWAIIAAPRCLGRAVSAKTFSRFLRDGASSVSPHTIPQHSLHSVSGAISILLSCRGPNLGVGGGPGAIDDAFLTAATLLQGSKAKHAWLVCTGWDPEPIPDAQGGVTNEPVCQAFALALDLTQTSGVGGSLEYRVQPSHQSLSSRELLTHIVDEFESENRRISSANIAWQTNWGASVRLQVQPRASEQSRAA